MRASLQPVSWSNTISHLAAAAFFSLLLGCERTGGAVTETRWFEISGPVPDSKPCPLQWHEKKQLCRQVSLSRSDLPPPGTVSLYRYGSPKWSFEGLKCRYDLCLRREPNGFYAFFEERHWPLVTSAKYLGITKKYGQLYGLTLIPDDSSRAAIYLPFGDPHDSISGLKIWSNN